MKRMILNTVLALLGLVIFTSCKDKDIIVGSHMYESLISDYVIPKSYQAKIFEGKLRSSQGTQWEKVYGLYISPGDWQDFNAFRYDTKQEHKVYAERYQDTSYNRNKATPNETYALAEPLDSIRCYTLSSSGAKTDISNQLKCRIESYLPYIRNGYQDKLVPTPVYWTIGGEAYEIYKPLKELTQEDLTLIAIHNNVCMLIESIAPYQFDSDVIVEIYSSSDDHPKEIMAKYTPPSKM